MKILHITDTHLGVKGIPTKSIYDGAVETFFSNKQYADVDAIAITGDVYDEALDHSSEDALYSNRFATHILKWAKENDVVVLLLEGTPSHDRRQSRWWVELNKLHNINAKLYYFNELGVHFIPELGINVLAVPDEITKPRVKTDGLIKALLKEKKLDQVELALTHAYFDFHLPKHEVHNGHSYKYFNKIVKWITLNGHIHTPSFRFNVLTGGSLARTRHGEEERKGGHLIEIKPDGSAVITFIENRILIPFKTIKVHGFNSDKIIAKIEKTIKGWAVGNLRLHYKRKDGAGLLLNYLREKYPTVNFSTKVDKLELEVNKNQEQLDAKISAISLNKNNLPRLINEGLLEKYGEVEGKRLMSRFKESFLEEQT